MSAPTVDFSISRPGNWRELDLLDARATAMIGEELVAALIRLGAGSDNGRLLMARSLFTAAADGRHLAMGLVVTLAGPDSPASETPLTAEEFSGREVSAISLFLGMGLRLRSVKTAPMPGGVNAQTLTVQYLIQTEVGLVTMTFTTPNGVAAGTEEWEELFAGMAATAQLVAAD